MTTQAPPATTYFRCTRCGEPADLVEFGKRRGGKMACRVCRHEETISQRAVTRNKRWAEREAKRRSIGSATTCRRTAPMPDATTVAACPHGVAESAIEPYWKWADTRGVEVMVCVCCDAPGPVEFLRLVVLLGEDEIPIE